MSDAFLYVGFALTAYGVFLVFGLGVACIVAGLTLFVAGGLASVRRERPTKTP